MKKILHILISMFLVFLMSLGCGTLLTIVTKLKWGLRLTLFIIKGGGEGLAGRLCIYAENRGQGADHKQLNDLSYTLFKNM